MPTAGAMEASEARRAKATRTCSERRARSPTRSLPNAEACVSTEPGDVAGKSQQVFPDCWSFTWNGSATRCWLLVVVFPGVLSCLFSGGTLLGSPVLSPVWARHDGGSVNGRYSECTAYARRTSRAGWAWIWRPSVGSKGAVIA